MRVRCPGCGTHFGVDPKKVPEGGVRARCARCPTIFHVGVPGGPPPSGPSDTAEEAGAAIQPASPAGSARMGAPQEPQEPPPTEPPVASGGSHAEGGEPAVAEASRGPGAPQFGSADPHDRARRLARALVSDIATYHGDRLDRGLRDGNLRHELGPEIRKSWDEYTTQVGNQIARETSYFRDALNEILARGARHF